MNTRLFNFLAASGLTCLFITFGTVAGFGQSGPVYSYTANGNLQAVNSGSAVAPSLVAQPQSELIQSNAYATFTVLANGNGLSYQWLSNGVAIIGANGDSLVVGNLPLTGATLANYSVIISNVYGSVTSSPAPLWSDANGNGIPDWWELQYFGNLNQPALGDYDGDGVDNLDEYLEGTNPTNRLSFNPRLNIQAPRGSVVVSPRQPYYTHGQVVSLTAIPDFGEDFVGWSGGLTGNKASIALVMSTNEYVTATFGLALGIALDNTNLVWSTSGDALWFGQAEESEDGLGAAQSGPVVSYYNGGNFVGDQTVLQTSFYLAQPMQLSFWWDVSSQPPDAVTFMIGTNVVGKLSGESVAWQYFQTNLAIGTYTLTWTYSKGPVNIPDGSIYADAAWVDRVSLTTAATTVPLLSIQMTGPNTAILSWPGSAGTFTLQQTASLTPPNWVNATNSVNLVSGINQAVITLSGNEQFYRLSYP